MQEKWRHEVWPPLLRKSEVNYGDYGQTRFGKTICDLNLDLKSLSPDIVAIVLENFADIFARMFALFINDEMKVSLS